jgi:two-component system nitrogen regulation sensor histidine kinase NtrY
MDEDQKSKKVSLKELFRKFSGKTVYLLIASGIFFLAAFLVNNLLYTKTSAYFYSSRIQSEIQQKERDFQKLSKDTALLRELASRKYDETTLNRILDKSKGFGIFLYELSEEEEPRLVFWNTHDILPHEKIISKVGGPEFLKLANGYYVHDSRQVVLNRQQYSLEMLIPVQWQYFVEIENLRKEFYSFPEASSKVEISEAKTDFPVKSISGDVLFYLQRKSGGVSENSWLVTVCILLGTLFLMAYLHRFALYLTAKFGILKGFGFLLGVIVILRLCTYLFPEILKLNQYYLFKPLIYGTGRLLPSLGDLLLNSLLFCWIIYFLNLKSGMLRYIKPFKEDWKNVMVQILLGSILVASTFGFIFILHSLITDGQISFNVSNFFNLIPYSFIGFFIIGILTLSFFMLSQILLNLSRKFRTGPDYVFTIITAAIGLVVLTLLPVRNILELNLYALLWLVIYIQLMQTKVLKGLNFRLKISEMLFWLFIFSVSITAVILSENKKIEYEQRLRFAERLYQTSDPAGERLLSISLAYIDEDFLTPNFHRFLNEEENRYIKDSIINKNFSPYLNRYDTRIYTFDSSSRALYNEDPISFDTLSTIFQIQGKPTSIAGLRYFEKSFDKFSYIYYNPVVDTLGYRIGHFFILADPKNYKTDALIPELFKQNRQLVPEYSSDYAYAVYNGNELIDYYNDYPFPTTLSNIELPKTELRTVSKKDHVELWYRPAADKVIVVVKKDNIYTEAITLFAYLFSSFLILLAIYQLGGLIVKSGGSLTALRKLLQLSIRSQIHSTIISISLLSFLIIGVVTIMFFINRYDRNNKERLRGMIQIMTNELESELNFDHPYSDVYSKLDVISQERLERILEDISQIHGTDVNLYDTSGVLRASSNPLVYNKGVLNNVLNPMAFYHLKIRNAIQYTGEERMGKVNYLSIYCPVRDEDGVAYGYLNIPFFSTQTDLKKEISNFLVTIINLNAFIFMIAGAIAFFITNRITSSFTIIGQKMRDINLQKSNQEIVWKRNDEIGQLVMEYNKMVNKLDASAELMAKTEREGAWRQMARQVAHEIKNPLTPMKLSIQYLQKAIDNNSPNVKELTGSVARTLVEQIDHLSKIAADFSQFANIGNPKNEMFDLHDLLSSLLYLYQSREELELSWEPVEGKVMLFADKTQLNRMFTNLIQNGIDASEGRENMKILIKERLDGDQVIISITDNGTGIPEAMQEKIFTPNFTTKSSGTGLGLAMSKSIAQQANGDIWFETEENVGTTFYVRLPYVRISP